MNKIATYESLEDSLEFKKPGTAKSKTTTVRGQSQSRILENSFNLSEVNTVRSQDASYTVNNHDNRKQNSRNITGMHSILEDSINNRETMTRSSLSQTKQVIRESIHTLRSDSINMRASSFGGESDIIDEIDQPNDDNNSIWNDDQDPDISRNTLMKASSNLKTSKLKTLNHLTKIEYTGPVKKMCLLGSGSEAKVFFFCFLTGYINHFNKVYLVKIKDFDELLALKQYEVVKNNGRSIQSYDSLKKEFNMLRQINNDNIIQYYCLYKPRKISYNNSLEYGVIMEFLSGGSLETYIEESFEEIQNQDKKNFCRQILEGLIYLHEFNIIHRDLKVTLISYKLCLYM